MLRSCLVIILGMNFEKPGQLCETLTGNNPTKLHKLTCIPIRQSEHTQTHNQPQISSLKTLLTKTTKK